MLLLRLQADSLSPAAARAWSPRAEKRRLLGHVYAKEMRTGAFRPRDLVIALPDLRRESRACASILARVERRDPGSGC